MIVRLISVCVLLLASRTFAEPTRDLLDVKYTAQPDMSRLSLTFNSPIRFLHKKLNAQLVRLTFPQAGSSKYANGVPMIFRNGFATSVSFDFSRNDTVAVLISLHDKVTYDLRRENESIIMELYSSDTTQAVAPIGNIKALVQQQILEAPNVAASESPKQSVFDIEFVPFLAAVFISLLGTSGMMYWIIQPTPPTKPAPARRALPHATTASGVDAILAQAKLILEEKTGHAAPKFALENNIVDREDDGLRLAHKFKRGQGELQLARTFENRNRQYLWEKKLQQLGSGGNRREVIASAKKLGVGKGELNLALSLQRMKDVQLKREPLT